MDTFASKFPPVTSTVARRKKRHFEFERFGERSFSETYHAKVATNKYCQTKGHYAQVCPTNYGIHSGCDTHAELCAFQKPQTAVNGSYFWRRECFSEHLRMSRTFEAIWATIPTATLQFLGQSRHSKSSYSLLKSKQWKFWLSVHNNKWAINKTYHGQAIVFFGTIEAQNE